MEDKALVGVIGGGSFGMAVSLMIAGNTEVLMLVRTPETKAAINDVKFHKGVRVPDGLRATTDPKYFTEHCQLIFPIVPSGNFRDAILSITPWLTKSHILIHGTKGLDIRKGLSDDQVLERTDVSTMTEVIEQVSPVFLTGCLAGPNLAGEILEGQIAATVIASKNEQVIKYGRKVLENPKLKVYGSSDLIGAEWTGILKNPIAIAAGMLQGIGIGENGKAFLITKGLAEMIRLGDAMGSDKTAFLGLAGVGDLIATCNSNRSRNFSLGFKVAKGLTIQEALNEIGETAEGLNTLSVVLRLAKSMKVRMPIMQMLHHILGGHVSAEEGIARLMQVPFNQDVDFL